VVGRTSAELLIGLQDNCGGVIVVLLAMAAGNVERSFGEGLGDFGHIDTLIGGEVAKLICALQQHQNDVLHRDAGLLCVGVGDADIEAELFGLRPGAAPLDQGRSSRASTVWALPSNRAPKCFIGLHGFVRRLIGRWGL
jgi:hypothetical protein